MDIFALYVVPYGNSSCGIFSKGSVVSSCVVELDFGELLDLIREFQLFFKASDLLCARENHQKLAGEKIMSRPLLKLRAFVHAFLKCLKMSVLMSEPDHKIHGRHSNST